jgi:hypothetical protein
MPKDGLVAVKASEMSKNWYLHEELDIDGQKTIQGMMQSTGPQSYLPKSSLKYALQGTCIGSVQFMVVYLTTPVGILQEKIVEIGRYIKKLFN